MHSNIAKSSLAMTIFAAISAATIPAQAALLVSSGGDNSIKQYDEITGAYIRDFVTAGSGGLFNPQGLDIGPNGNLFVSSQNTSSIKEYSGITGEYIGDFVSLDDDSIFPTAPLIGLTFAEDGNLFVASPVIPMAKNGEVQLSGILQYNGTTGELLNGFITGAAGFTPVPIDVVVGGSNNSIFFSESSKGFNPGGIREYDPTISDFTQLSVSPHPLSTLPFEPQGLALEGNKLFFTNGREVGLIDLIINTSDSFFVDTSSGGLNSAIGLTVGEDGNLYVSNSETNSIKKYDGDTGNYLGDFVTSGSGGLSSPTYLTTANVPVPEPSSVLGIAALGGLFVGGALRGKANRRKQLNLL